MVDPLTVKPPFPAGRGPGSLAPFSEQDNDEVGVPVLVVVVVVANDDGEAWEALVVEAVAVFEDREVVATVGLPIARVVLSGDVVSIPSISVAIMVVPSVTVVSGTPTSGVGEGACAADCFGRAMVNTTNTKRHSSAFRTFLAVTVSMFFLHRVKMPVYCGDETLRKLRVPIIARLVVMSI